MLGFQEIRLISIAAVLCVCGISAQTVSSGESVTGTSEATAEQCASVPPTVVEPTVLSIPFRACFTEEPKLSILMERMSAVLGMLNNDRDYTDSKLQKLKEMPKLQEYELCSEERIQQLTEELRWVSRRLWELSIRLEEPVETEVDQLDKRKIDLIRHLHNIRVFSVGSSTLATPMQLQSFDIKIEYLDYGFNTALVMFQTNRTIRPTLSPVRFAENAVIQSILDPSKSKADLIEMSRDQPTAMSKALPQLVSNWYARKLRNVQLLLDFIKQLPNLVHQMIGYASLYDAMSANSDLESYELTEFVLQLKGINASVTSAADGIPLSVLTRYTQLVDDVWPVYHIVGRNTSCDFKNLKYSTSLLSGGSNIVSLHSVLNSPISRSVHVVQGTAMFTTIYDYYSSSSDIFSASKRNVKHREPPVFELFAQWKLVLVKGGKYFKILNAKYDEVLFADKTEMNPTSGSTNYRRVFLTRHDYSGAYDYEQNADLWIVKCA